MTDPSTSTPNIYPVLCYRNGRAAIDWLARAFGFRPDLEVPAEGGCIAHAELSLGRDKIMLAGGGAPDPANPWTTERGGVYVAVGDIDAHHAQSRASGAKIVRPLSQTSYGAREYSARDIEGHLWSFGTYDPKSSTLVEGRSNAAITAEFQRIEGRFSEAIVSNDVEKIKACITEDWCLVTPEKGPIDGADVLAAIASGTLSHDTMSKRLARAVVYGDMAVATGRGRNTGLFRGEHISADEWITDTYRRIDGEWRCCLTHLTPAARPR